MKKLILLMTIAVMLMAPSAVFANIMTETVFTDFYSFGEMHTYDYASWMHFSRETSRGERTGIFIGTNDNLPNQLSWGHTLPAGLQVPPDVITRATLWIDGARIDGNNNEIAIEGTFSWDPLNHRFFDNSRFDLTDIDAPGFWNDGFLDVTVFAGEGKLRIDNAVLMMDYVSGGAGTPAIPEPATLSLVGLGLLGMGLIRRKKK